MQVAEALLARARRLGSSLAVVGTSKNAGKSVVVAALVEALAQAGEPFGLCSIGRDGEAIDVIERTPKPRFFVRPGAVVATARALVPSTPAWEIVGVSGEHCALGPIVIARVRAASYVEIAGPASARAVRRVVEQLRAHVSFVVIDGAVDRIAALRGGDDAIVVAVGAAAAPTIEQAVDEAAALVARLAIAPLDADRPFVVVTGALSAARAATFVRAGEARQVVVEDATQIAVRGRAFLQLAAALDLRCVRPLRPIACTVAPVYADRFFAPRSFARAVAERTRLPTYDVYLGTEVVGAA